MKASRWDIIFHLVQAFFIGSISLSVLPEIVIALNAEKQSILQKATCGCFVLGVIIFLVEVIVVGTLAAHNILESSKEP